MSARSVSSFTVISFTCFCCISFVSACMSSLLVRLIRRSSLLPSMVA